MPCVNVPQIVSQTDLTGKTAAISETTLYSPSGSDSLNYRLSVYMNNSSAATGNAKMNLNYTDDFGAVTQSVVVGPSAVFMAQVVFVLHVASSTSITFDVTIPGGGTVSFDLHMTLEEL